MSPFAFPLLWGAGARGRESVYQQTVLLYENAERSDTVDADEYEWKSASCKAQITKNAAPKHTQRDHRTGRRNRMFVIVDEEVMERAITNHTCGGGPPGRRGLSPARFVLSTHGETKDWPTRAEHGSASMGVGAERCGLQMAVSGKEVERSWEGRGQVSMRQPGMGVQTFWKRSAEN